MYKATVYTNTDIPSYLRHLLEQPASAVLVIEQDDAVVSFFSAREDGAGYRKIDLDEICLELNRAYSFGAKGFSQPSNNSCALIANEVAEEYRQHGRISAMDSLEQKRFYAEARKYDDVCDRFLRGIHINFLYDDQSQKVKGYSLKGDGGYAYFLNQSANSCSCHVGRNSTDICWHMRAVECYLAAIQRANHERN